MIRRWTVSRAFPIAALLTCLLPFLVIPQSPLSADDVADATVDDAVGVVRGLTANIWSSRDQIAEHGDRRHQIARMIEGSTSVDLLSRLALGRHWRALEADDRQEYRTLFSEVVIGGLAGRLDTLLRELDGSLEQRFSITKSMAAGKRDVLVRSRMVAADNQPLTIDWRLRELDTGPVIIDLVVEGVSLLVTQRAEFAAVIERSQIDGLIEALRHRARNGDF